jgi:adenine-specific DNA-methyltransferase
MSNIERLDLHTPDFVNENIEKIAAFFPNCVTETAEGKKIDFDLLQQELSYDIVEGNRERYRLEWPGKREAIVTANLPTTKTLRPVREDSVDFDNTENLYIEGDNLEVLKLLQESYFGKIKMIYIDPPYNTGNDFVYKDNFATDRETELFESGQIDEYNRRMVANPETSGRYHSDWLTMMYPRLKLARNLLTDDGVIFISIDDNEVHNLRKICDEIFGEDNFVIQIVWRRSDNQPNIGNIARVKEYILCYCKDFSRLNLGRLPLSDKAKNEYRYNDAKGLFRRSILLDKTRGRHFYPKTTKNGNVLNGPWMVKEEEFNRMDLNEEIYWTSGGDEQPYGKIYLEESKGQIPNDFWGIEFGTNQRASLEVERLFNKRYFDFPKPMSLVSTLTRIGALDVNSIILDFFSGSATTAHAVMQLNAEDGGKRKYIMVQLPELTDENSEAYKAGYKNICEIGKERIRRAANKIKEEKRSKAEKEGLFANVEDTQDYGFRVYRLDSSNMKDVYYRPQDYKQESMDMFADNIKPDRTADDLLAQVMLDWGLPLSYKIDQIDINGKQVFRVAQDSLLACFDTGIDEAFAKEIAKEKPLRVVFRDSGFAGDTAKINVQQLLKQLTPETEMKVI